MNALALGAFLLVVGGPGLLAVSAAPRLPWLDRLLLALPVGLAAFPAVVLALRALHLPLDVRLLAAIGAAAAILAAGFFRGARAEPSPPPRRRGFALGAALVAAALAGTMYHGATRYPWLEDDDPWQHAAAARYVALHGRTAQPPGEARASIVLEPYPPYYAALMGVLHQANPDLEDVLKFFNALVVGISVLAAFFAFEAMSGSAAAALAAAALLAVCPAYMSHFIWAQTLAVPCFLAAAWALAGGSAAGGARSAGFWLTAALVWASTVVQPSSAAASGLLLALAAAVVGLVSRARREPAPWRPLAAVAAAGAASLATWGLLSRAQLQAYATTPGVFRGGAGADTSGGLVYGFLDVVLANRFDKIDQGTGLGWATAALAAAGVAATILAARPSARATLRPWALVLVAWTAVALVGIEGNALPLKLFPHRFWVYLAIPAAALAAEGARACTAWLREGRARFAAAAALVVAAFATNVGPRLWLQDTAWPPGSAWSDMQHAAGYAHVAAVLPRWTRVLTLCFRDEFLVGLDLAAEPWDPALAPLRARLATASGEEVIGFARARRYQYLLVDAACVDRLGRDGARALVDRLRGTGQVELALDDPGALLVRVAGVGQAAPLPVAAP
ncbi:MAG TPA: hypothetical protein VLU43_04130 [Anaeromyxobacteraceae bacterium]|nr:hypothetical protein [Anaeromyxobacteraceae bacterium]